METNRTQSECIDDAFGALLMAKDILDQVIPNSDDRASIEIAKAFAGQLIQLAVRRLGGSCENGGHDNVVRFGTQ